MSSSAVDMDRPSARVLAATALVVTAICFLFTYLYYGFYYVEYEGMFDSFYSGRLTDGMPFRSIYFLGNIGLSYIYSALYEWVPAVEWMSWILYAYLFLSCWLALYILLHLLSEVIPLGFGCIIAGMVYLLVFADHNIHFLFTRVSYMIVGVALIAIVYFFRERDSIRRRPLLFLLLNAWCVIGVLTRVESATAALLQVLCFAIYYITDVRQLVRCFLFPIVFVGCVLGGIAYDLRTTIEYYKQVEPEIEAQLTDRENAVPLSAMHTHIDSVKWAAVREIMWPDPRVLTPAYMRSLIMPEQKFFTDIRQWKRSVSSVAQIISRYWYLCLIAAWMAMGLLISKTSFSVSGWLRWAIFTSSFWWLILMQTYTDKINDRSFNPLISIFLLCYIVALSPSFIRLRRMVVILFPVLVLLMIHLSRLSDAAQNLETDWKKYQATVTIIRGVARDKILAINSASCDYLFLSNKPFHSFDFSAFRKVYVTDGFNIPFLPYYRRYLERECQCDVADFPSFWRFLHDHRAEVIVVSTPSRMKLLTDYLLAVHHYDLSISEIAVSGLPEVEKSDYPGSFTKLAVYRLKNY
ncbi:MAG: hypothetical protein JST76_08350 [Bacteroidetes bacterium]|nr:hypothetical protein [Bacteroidota bacterium]